MQKKQKDIYYADLTRKSKSKGRNEHLTPVAIISGNVMNNNSGMCIVSVLSTNVKHYGGCVVLMKDKINRLEQDSEIIPFQVRTISQDRLIKKIGRITDEQLHQVIEGLSDVLKW
jgi:mRNA interferase MazF